MLLREDVVLRRAARVSSSSRWRDVGVGGQGVGGLCLCGHVLCVDGVVGSIYLAQRVRRRLVIFGLFYDLLCLRRKG